jgi:hypothetical protein
VPRQLARYRAASFLRSAKERSLRRSPLFHKRRLRLILLKRRLVPRCTFDSPLVNQ